MERELIARIASLLDFIVGKCRSLSSQPISKNLARSLDLKSVLVKFGCFIIIEPMGVLFPGVYGQIQAIIIEGVRGSLSGMLPHYS